MKKKSESIIAKSIVFSVIMLSGVALYSIVIIFNVNWYFPYLGFGLAVYFAWQEFFIEEEQSSNKNDLVLNNDEKKEMRHISRRPKST